MIFTETELKGAFIIELEKFEDERGFFALTWSHSDFVKRGLESQLAECNISFNEKKGTLRGMHYQEAPHGQTKLVRCTMGAIYDVIADLRPESSSLRRWTAIELTANNRRTLFIPEGFAHGFQALEDNTEVLYQMSECYHPESGRGFRWDDPAFAIYWPLEITAISERDRSYPLLGSARKES